MRHRHRLYLHTDGHWSGQEEGAIVRLDAQMRQETTTEVENRFYRRSKEGSWEAVDPQALDASQRGLIFEAWRVEAGGRPLLCFRGARVVDDEIATLLASLSVYDEDGRPLADPKGAGRSFLLSAEGAKIFAERVRSADGRVERVGVLPQDAQRASGELVRAGGELEAMLALDHAALAAARRGDHSQLADFLVRHEGELERLAAIERARSEIRAGAQRLLAPGRSEQEQSDASVLIAHADDALEQAREALEERGRLEDEMRRLGEERLHKQRAPVSRRLLLAEVARLAREANCETIVDGEELVIIIDQQRLRLPQFRLD